MPIVYRMDILAALKERGYSTYRIRKDKIFSESTLQAFRSGTMVSYDTLEKLCELLGCQPGDILEYAEEGVADAEEG